MFNERRRLIFLAFLSSTLFNEPARQPKKGHKRIVHAHDPCRQRSMADLRRLLGADVRTGAPFAAEFGEELQEQSGAFAHEARGEALGAVAGGVPPIAAAEVGDEVETVDPGFEVGPVVVEVGALRQAPALRGESRRRDGSGVAAQHGVGAVRRGDGDAGVAPTHHVEVDLEAR